MKVLKMFPGILLAAGVAVLACFLESLLPIHVIGSAVNDTSSVVATGYAFSEGAGDFATMVKLTRTLWIIPTVITFAFVPLRLKRKEALAANQNGMERKANFQISKIFPWFILGFLAMSVAASVFAIPPVVVTGTKTEKIRKQKLSDFSI